MKSRVFFVLMLLSLSKTITAQSVRLIDFETLEKRIKSPSDTTFIVHFWATWCKPCLTEMPVFNQIDQSDNNQKLQIVLISLDFIKDLVSVNDFFKTKPFNADVFLLDAPDQNSWIDKVSKQWTGGIPATLFLNNTLKKQKFIENSLTLEQLQTEISGFRRK
jgi:thiol-disulfide isomerase/thioredoxin